MLVVQCPCRVLDPIVMHNDVFYCAPKLKPVRTGVYNAIIIYLNTDKVDFLIARLPARASYIEGPSRVCVGNIG